MAYHINNLDIGLISKIIKGFLTFESFKFKPEIIIDRVNELFVCSKSFVLVQNKVTMSLSSSKCSGISYNVAKAFQKFG